MISRDSLEQCYTPETAAEFVLQMGDFGDAIEGGRLTDEAFGLFLDVFAAELSIRFKGEDDGPFVEEIE